jgi:hypothetical protein
MMQYAAEADAENANSSSCCCGCCCCCTCCRSGTQCPKTLQVFLAVFSFLCMLGPAYSFYSLNDSRIWYDQPENVQSIGYAWIFKISLYAFMIGVGLVWIYLAIVFAITVMLQCLPACTMFVVAVFSKRIGQAFIGIIMFLSCSFIGVVYAAAYATSLPDKPYNILVTKPVIAILISVGVYILVLLFFYYLKNMSVLNNPLTALAVGMSDIRDAPQLTSATSVIQQQQQQQIIYQQQPYQGQPNVQAPLSPVPPVDLQNPRTFPLVQETVINYDDLSWNESDEIGNNANNNNMNAIPDAQGPVRVGQGEGEEQEEESGYEVVHVYAP